MKILVRYILAASLLAGILDIGLAFLNAWLSNGTSPSAVLRFVASGVYGNQAFSGNSFYETMGMILHLLITLIWTIAYFVIANRLPAAVKHWVIAGIVYGVLVFLVMNLLMVPLSATPKIPFQAFAFFRSMIIQVLGTGLPISWLYAVFAFRAGRRGSI